MDAEPVLTNETVTPNDKERAMRNERTVTVTFEGRGSDGQYFKYTQQVDATGTGDNPLFYIEGFTNGLDTAAGRVRAAVVASYGQPG